MEVLVLNFGMVGWDLKDRRGWVSIASLNTQWISLLCTEELTFPTCLQTRKDDDSSSSPGCFPTSVAVPLNQNSTQYCCSKCVDEQRWWLAIMMQVGQMFTLLAQFNSSASISFTKQACPIPVDEQ
ncbi:Uncharacterized protein TCM_019435 [Theobroma cacao]|uniref:Uncharacterized protein n=1 Tax=Theobroma cacao TaxID=3641 RepID=A0A061EIH1_THECC|nr:Uncharacterized protein TCM_019435 [Theobroma cacao]